MAKMSISAEQKTALKKFLKANPGAELISAYLYFVEKKFKFQPVLFVRDKLIFENSDEVVKHLEKEGKLWHETEIKIGFAEADVNEQTKKIYICPFTGKVFGDNTHPNPQDAIYDWVSKCPENKERVGGLRVKRFFVSEDPEVINNYMSKAEPQKKAITKTVYTSELNGKLFNSKQAVIDDFKRHYLKSMSLVEVQTQDRFSIEDDFLTAIQKQLEEDRIAAFIEALAEHEEFGLHITQWLEAE